MKRKIRHFGKQFKEYREEYLGIKQLEAAEQLSISSSPYRTTNGPIGM